MNILFKEAHIGKIKLKNRLIRSATFEGMADNEGFPKKEYRELYLSLAKHNVGALITGFTYVSKEGRAMQPGQAGLDASDKILSYSQIVDDVHRFNTPIFMQLAHCGRQTSRKATNGYLWGVSSKESRYFQDKPDVISTRKAYTIIKEFVESAKYAQEAGFDGVQLHAAHGYLIHQFLAPGINNRKDKFGVSESYQLGISFLDLTIDSIRNHCGSDFPILIKISANADNDFSFSERQFINLVNFLDTKKVAAIEISYGSMEQPLNIFRGTDIPVDTILEVNPRYKEDAKLKKQLFRKIILPILSKHIKSFTPAYNLDYARLAKQYTSIPIISVGGFRNYKEMETSLHNQDCDFISCSRPFICELDFGDKLLNSPNYQSHCNNCNCCTVMCDSINITKCYQK